MDKERLEEIKTSTWNICECETCYCENFKPHMIAVDPKHFEWLIEQAEKREYWMKQHRKRANELEDAYFKIQLVENQLHQAQAKAERYKQALEEIARGRFPGASYIAKQALEVK